jgi:hypothetical protein
MPSTQRELHFFDRFFSSWPGPDEVERYHRFFPRPNGVLTGEKTPTYFADHWIPRMLHDAAPAARLIVLLRDPIERFRSGRTHARDHGWADDRRIVGDHFARGLYAEQLERYLDHFAREQVLVLQYERCVVQKEVELARTYTFLGLPPHEADFDELTRQRGTQRTEKLELEAERQALMVDLYSRDIERLVTLVPDLDLSLWPNFKLLARPPSP